MLRKTTFFILLCCLGFSTLLLQAQTLENFTKQADGFVNLRGWLTVTYGDPLDSSQDVIRLIRLQTPEGQHYELAMNPNQAQALHSQFVNVAGRLDANTLTVHQMQNALETGTRDFGNRSNAVSGAQPHVNILCRFSDDSSTPMTPTTVQSLFSATSPALNHYWKEISYNNITINGTTTANQWVNLPQPRSTYISEVTGADLDALFNDCTAAADSLVNYSNFVGINMFFNADLDCCAWGGGQTATLDGVTKFFRVTWLPPWAATHGVIAHEMGHGFGFPHSTGPADNPPTGLSIYVSNWDVMSGTSDCSQNIVPFACISANTITKNLNDAGWIPSNRRVVIGSGVTQTVTLDRTDLPAGTTNPLMIEVPIGDLETYYYTVEVRGHNSYDVNTPGAGVIIHEVDIFGHTGNGGPAHVVDANDGNDDVNDAGARWLVGETFTDAVNNISIQVQSQSGSTYTVRVVNDSVVPPPPPNDLIADATVITSLPYSDTLSTTMATDTGTDPVPSCGFGVGKTVWYRFTPTVAGTYTFDTVDSSFDTVLSVWSGAINNLIEADCNDDAVGLTSAVSPNLNAGTTYYILIGGYGSEAGDLTFNADAELIIDYDVNNDGRISALDAIFVVNRLGQSPTGGNAPADINQDNQITNADVFAVLDNLSQ